MKGENTMSETGHLHFRINLDWLTNFIRDLWAEGSYERALRTLKYIPTLTDEQRIGIIRGKWKMVGTDNDGHLEPDNWHPNLDHCHRGAYPDPNELPALASSALDYRAKWFEVLRYDWEDVKIKLDVGIQLAGHDRNNWYSVIALYPEEFILTLPEDDQALWRLSGRPRPAPNSGSLMTWSETGAASEPQTVVNGVLIPTLDEYMAHQHELEDKQTPNPDPTYEAGGGWILPNGELYPCDWQDHDWLAYRLGKEVKDAEAEGWIRVGVVGLRKNINHQGGAPVTSAQENALINWCIHHETTIPSWAHEVEERQ